MHPEFYNLNRLFALRAALESAGESRAPKALVASAVDLGGAKRIGIFPGSFNPPTDAHVELARAAKESFNLDRVIFTVSVVTVDKECVEGLILEDRLMLLDLLAAELGWAGSAVVNRGLYFEQAQAFRSLLGKSARISFVAGMDKLEQIFDARYYSDREAALRTLLTEAHLLVAARGQLGMAELEEILKRPENEPYRDRVFCLAFPTELRDLSSSALRRGINEGRRLHPPVPRVVLEFITEMQAYLPGYDLRAKLLERLYAVREWAGEGVNFLKLLQVAREDSSRGRRLRLLLQSPPASKEALEKCLLELAGPL